MVIFRIIEFLLVTFLIIIGMVIFFGSIAIEIAHYIQEIIDENRTR